jgi:hypothetical protein
MQLKNLTRQRIPQGGLNFSCGDGRAEFFGRGLALNQFWGSSWLAKAPISCQNINGYAILGSQTISEYRYARWSRRDGVDQLIHAVHGHSPEGEMGFFYATTPWKEKNLNSAPAHRLNLAERHSCCGICVIYMKGNCPRHFGEIFIHQS